MVLSLVIPVYNVEEYIVRCLQSCLRISKYFVDFELILVDDGSTDNSAKIANNLLSSYQNVTILKKENGGLSSARNAGLDIAKGKYIWFIDSDDWIVPERIPEIIRLLNIYTPDIFQIQFQLAYEGDRYQFKYKTNLNGLVRGKDAIKDTQTPAGAPFSIFNRKFLLEYKLRFYEGILHEDVEFKPRALFYASSVYYYNEVCYYYYQRKSGSITSQLKLKNGLDEMIVAKSLDDFYNHQKMTKEIEIIFKRKVSAAIVGVFKVASQLNTPSKINQLMKLISQNKNLVIRNMLFSKKIKYVLIGVLCLIKPKINLFLYKLLIEKA